jgi:prepilin-type processing-associated H-X9-DG protein
MKLRPPYKQSTALTKIEVLVLIGVIAVALCVILPALVGANQKAKSICCNCNLKQIGLAFAIWESDHTNMYPMSVSTNFGGSQEYISTGQPFRHFQVMSNELSTPKVLICPRDSRRAAKDFASGFSNTNVSYFVGLLVNNNAYPEAFIAGDRNIVGGTKLPDGIIEITSKDPVSWGQVLHNGFGNIGFADGSVQNFSSARLHEALEVTGIATNRLEIP